jgi:hypothetical protein
MAAGLARVPADRKAASRPDISPAGFWPKAENAQRWLGTFSIPMRFQGSVESSRIVMCVKELIGSKGNGVTQSNRGPL